MTDHSAPPLSEPDDALPALSVGEAEVLAMLAGEAARQAPPPPLDLRARILNAARAQQFAFIPSTSGIWLPLTGGLGSAKDLFHDSADREGTRLLKLPVGASLPGRMLRGSRALFVVAGGIQNGRDELLPGDFADGLDDTTSWHATFDETLLLEFASSRRREAVTQRAATARWLRPFSGARLRPLHGPADADHELFVLDMDPRSTLGEHDHAGQEELYVLRGSCVIEGRRMERGDYHRAAAGSHHDPTATDEGCVLVVSVRNLARAA